MRELIHSKDLPKSYGGGLEWNFEDEPNLDDEASAAIAHMPKGPVIFVNGAVSHPEKEPLASA